MYKGRNLESSRTSRGSSGPDYSSSRAGIPRGQAKIESAPRAAEPQNFRGRSSKPCGAAQGNRAMRRHGQLIDGDMVVWLCGAWQGRSYGQRDAQPGQGDPRAMTCPTVNGQHFPRPSDRTKATKTAGIETREHLAMQRDSAQFAAMPLARAYVD